MGRSKSTPVPSPGDNDELDRLRGFETDPHTISITAWGARVVTNLRGDHTQPDGSKARVPKPAPKDGDEVTVTPLRRSARKAAQKPSIIESDSNSDGSDQDSHLDSEDESENIAVAYTPTRKAPDIPAIIKSDDDADSENESDNITVAPAPRPQAATSAAAPIHTPVSARERPRMSWKNSDISLTLGLKVIMEEFAKGKGQVDVSQIFASTFKAELASMGLTEPPLFAALYDHWQSAKNSANGKRATTGVKQRWDAVNTMPVADYDAMRARITAANPGLRETRE